MSRIPVNIAGVVPLQTDRPQLQVLPSSAAAPDFSGSSDLRAISGALDQIPGVARQIYGLVHAKQKRELQDQKDLDQLDRQAGDHLANRTFTDLAAEIDQHGTAGGYGNLREGDPSDVVDSIVAVVSDDMEFDGSKVERESFEKKLARLLGPTIRAHQLAERDKEDKLTLSDAHSFAPSITTKEEFEQFIDTLGNSLNVEMSRDALVEIFLPITLESLAAQGQEGVAGIASLSENIDPRFKGLLAKTKRASLEVVSRDKNQGVNKAFAAVLARFTREIDEAKGNMHPATIEAMVVMAADRLKVDPAVLDIAITNLRNHAQARREEKDREDEGEDKAAFEGTIARLFREVQTGDGKIDPKTVVNTLEEEGKLFNAPQAKIDAAAFELTNYAEKLQDEKVLRDTIKINRDKLIGDIEGEFPSILRNPAGIVHLSPPLGVNVDGETVPVVTKTVYRDMVFNRARAELLGLAKDPDIDPKAELLGLAKDPRPDQPPRPIEAYTDFLNQSGYAEPAWEEEMTTLAAQIGRPGQTAEDFNQESIKLARALNKVGILRQHLSGNEAAIVGLRHAFKAEAFGVVSVPEALVIQQTRKDEVKPGSQGNYLNIAPQFKKGGIHENITDRLKDLPGVNDQMLDNNLSTILVVEDLVKLHMFYHNVNADTALDVVMESIGETVLVVEGHLIDMTGVSNLSATGDMIRATAGPIIEWQTTNDPSSLVHANRDGLTLGFNRNNLTFHVSQPGGLQVVGSPRFPEDDIPDLYELIFAVQSEPGLENQRRNQRSAKWEEWRQSDAKDKIYESMNKKPAPTLTKDRIAENKRMKRLASGRHSLIAHHPLIMALTGKPQPGLLQALLQKQALMPIFQNNFLTAKSPAELEKQAKEIVVKRENIIANLLEKKMNDPTISHHSKKFMRWYVETYPKPPKPLPGPSPIHSALPVSARFGHGRN